MGSYWQTHPIVGPIFVNEFHSIGQKRIRSAAEKFILSKQPDSVLDVGCNTGVEGYRLFQKGFKGKYYGIDSNKKAIDCAKINLNKENAVLQVADAISLPFEDHSIDIVLCKDVLEHVNNHRDILKELSRVCRHFLIISLFIKLGKRERIRYHSDGYYLNQYSYDDFKGYKIIYEDKSNQLLVKYF